jgi:plastocyanin
MDQHRGDEMIRRLNSVGIVAAIALAVLSMVPIVGAAPRAAETKTVSIKGFAFNPKAITINVGDTVTWTNDDTATHSATASDKSFDSGSLAAGTGKFSFTFDKAGTFSYACKFHDIMQGTIEVTDAAMAAPAAPATQSATGSVDAADQAIQDGTVTVAKATISVPGWVVIHLDQDGKPGKVIGFSALKAGDNTNVVVKLTETVPAGGKVWPMVHIDVGVVGTYEFPGADMPLMNGSDVVMKQIAITAPAASAPDAQMPMIAAADQPLKNGSVTVTDVYAAQDGWVVVHLDQDGKPGKVIGETLVKKGETKNVVVKLAEAVPVGGKVWPMLHIDAGVIGTYEFPGADVPVANGSDVVMKQIAVTAASAAPSTLPNTGGNDSPMLILVLAALALFTVGAVTRRLRI